MIRVVTGTPGTGKTCYAVLEIADALSAGKCVATNVALSADFARSVARRNPRNLLRLDRKAAELAARVAVLEEPEQLRLVWPSDRREGQTLVVIDEAHALLDSRDYRASDRQDWITWLTQHRKLGLDILFVVQHFEMLDTNVRRLVEWEVRLRDLRRARAYGFPVPIPLTVGHWYWIGMKKPQRTQTYSPRRAYGLFDTTATLHGVSRAQPPGAIVLPALAPAERSDGGAEPGVDPTAALRPVDALVAPPAPRADLIAPEKTKGAAVGSATPSRQDALPASVDVGP